MVIRVPYLVYVTAMGVAQRADFSRRSSSRVILRSPQPMNETSKSVTRESVASRRLESHCQCLRLTFGLQHLPYFRRQTAHHSSDGAFGRDNPDDASREGFTHETADRAAT